MNQKLLALCVLFALLLLSVTEGMSAPVGLDEIGDAYKATNSIRLSGYFYEGKYYGYYSTYSKLSKIPRWNIDKDEPPFSVKSAVLAAKNYARGIFQRDAELKISKVALDNYLGGIWMYEIQLYIYIRGTGFMHTFARTGPMGSIEVLVLMDGTIPDRKEEIDDLTTGKFILKSK